MKKVSRKLTIQPMWTSYIQCLKAMSDYLELGHSTAWIFGATGHGFIMNVHPELCPSGPTAFEHKPLEILVRNLGFTLYGTEFSKADPDFKIKQKQAFETVKMAMEHELPTFAWEMDKPEYYMLQGIDKENYHFIGFDGKTHKIKWDEVGNSELGMVVIKSANPESKVADNVKILKDSLTFALDFAKGKKDWIMPDYFTGIKAYNTWIEALQKKNYGKWGLPYNSQVWSECKTNAYEFLKELKLKLKTNVLDNLIEQYEIISWSMQKVASLFPVGEQDINAEKIETAVDTLFLAKEAEKTALAEMKLVLTQL